MGKFLLRISAASVDSNGFLFQLETQVFHEWNICGRDGIPAVKNVLENVGNWNSSITAFLTNPKISKKMLGAYNCCCHVYLYDIS